MPAGSGADRRARSHTLFAVALAGAVLLAPARPARGQDAVPRGPLGRDIPVYAPAAGDLPGREAPPLQNPAGTVTLRDAVTLALLQSPGLAAFAWETRAREARILQAGRPPNPVVSVLFEDAGARRLAGGGLDEPIQPQATIQLSQLVELGGKRASRERLAALDRDLAAWDYEAARIDVLTEVTQAFTDLLAAQDAVAQIERTTRLVEEVQQSVGLRVAAGAVSPIEETRAGVAAASVRVELARARRALEAGRTRLALLWGASTPAFTAVEGTLQRDPAPPPPFGVLAAGIEQNPELARWTAEVLQREAAVAVERSKAVPDVSVFAGYRRFTRVAAGAVVAGASIPLPLFDRNRGGIQEAQARAARAFEERRAAGSRVAAALAGAYAALASAYDEVTTLRSAVLPGSQQAFDAVSEGYRLGRFDYLDVLESQRTLIGAGTQYLRALADYHRAAASVERLIGAPLSGPSTPASGRE